MKLVRIDSELLPLGRLNAMRLLLRVPRPARYSDAHLRQKSAGNRLLGAGKGIWYKFVRRVSPTTSEKHCQIGSHRP